MRTTTIIARDSRAALDEIARQLGPDALVLETRRHPRGVEVVAALEGYVPQPQPRVAPTTSAFAAFAEQAALVGIPAETLDRIDRGDLADATDAWTRFLAMVDGAVHIAEPPHEGSRHICVVGGSGTGKTTVLAQIAARLRREDPVADIAFLAADAQRIGAREQLRLIGEALGIPVFNLGEATPAGVRLLIDMPSDPFTARQVADALRALPGGLHTLCTLPITAQLARHRQMLQLFDGVADSLVITHAGEALPPGALIAALVEAGVPLAYLSHDADPRSSIEPARASALYRLIVAALSGASGALQ